ncbi:MAG: epoxyqueuosine reductase QueH [Candidatus Omnitrophica bacterium]|nr:epoxyqueuosine reductase QueH [Candidatus Omnitrophota bacterium]MBU2043940.1 epoxyqueuosine reductase QueH [Candidatus Omnitrophota bacterium]MBU2474145.1 epoxyqueuosine reductase QueH [Candidatus Omnitrophota bacterium]
MKKVLLHICCGICAVYCIEKLRQESFQVGGLFFNPNIHPYPEYSKRKQAVEKVAETSGIMLEPSSYPIFDWLKIHQAYAAEKEGGLRCSSCYRMRLEQARLVAAEKDYDYFTTTLTVSPHKNSELIFEIGKDIGGDKFLALDFKKNDGFKKTLQAAKTLELYRQDYCGCIYSRK